MPDALSDLVTASNAFSGFVSSLGTLIQTKNEVATKKASAIIDKQYRDLQLRMNLQPGQEGRVDTRNFQDEFDKVNKNVESYLDSIADEGVRNAVKTNLGNQLSNIQLGLASSMAPGLIADAQSEANELLQVQLDTAQTAEQRLGAYNEWEQYVESKGIYSPAQMVSVRSQYQPMLVGGKAVEDSKREFVEGRMAAREEYGKILERVRPEYDAATKREDEIKAELEKLGAPVEGESEDVSAQRVALEAELTSVGDRKAQLYESIVDVPDMMPQSFDELRADAVSRIDSQAAREAALKMIDAEEKAADEEVTAMLAELKVAHDAGEASATDIVNALYYMPMSKEKRTAVEAQLVDYTIEEMSKGLLDVFTAAVDSGARDMASINQFQRIASALYENSPLRNNEQYKTFLQKIQKDLEALVNLDWDSSWGIGKLEEYKVIGEMYKWDYAVLEQGEAPGKYISWAYTPSVRTETGELLTPLQVLEEQLYGKLKPHFENAKEAMDVVKFIGSNDFMSIIATVAKTTSGAKYLDKAFQNLEAGKNLGGEDERRASDIKAALTDYLFSYASSNPSKTSLGDLQKAARDYAIKLMAIPNDVSGHGATIRFLGGGAEGAIKNYLQSIEAGRLSDVSYVNREGVIEVPSPWMDETAYLSTLAIESIKTSRILAGKEFNLDDYQIVTTGVPGLTEVGDIAVLTSERDAYSIDYTPDAGVVLRKYFKKDDGGWMVTNLTPIKLGEEQLRNIAKSEFSAALMERVRSGYYGKGGMYYNPNDYKRETVTPGTTGNRAESVKATEETVLQSKENNTRGLLE